MEKPVHDRARDRVEDSEEGTRCENHHANHNGHGRRIFARRPDHAAQLGDDFVAPSVNRFVCLQEDEEDQTDQDRKTVANEIVHEERAHSARRYRGDRFDQNADENADENARKHEADRDRFVRTVLLHGAPHFLIQFFSYQLCREAKLAGQEGLEPPTDGFGVRNSTN